MPNITTIKLLRVNLENDYRDTIWWGSNQAQIDYFNSKAIATFTHNDFTYQRKDGKIRFPAQYDDIMTCNYCMYKNSDYSNKWFYAFITDVEYINDGVTEITIETDVIQTWYFNTILRPCFIEREHTATDVVGENTVPEKVETGEYICNNIIKETRFEDYYYVLQATESALGFDWSATNYGGVFSAGGAFVTDDPQELAQVVQAYSSAGKAEAIFGCYIIPKSIIRNIGDDGIFGGMNSPVRLIQYINKPTKLNGYTPRNKKLLTYPYTFVNLTNNAGTTNTYHYEKFSTSPCYFEINGVPTVGGSVKCSPRGYNGLPADTVDENEGIMLGKFPTCSWSQDNYTNWLTQNALNIAFGYGASALQVIGGVASLNMGSAGGVVGVTGGIGGVFSQIGEWYQHKISPDTAQGNTNGGDINTCNKTNTFYFYEMSIKEEYAKIIDDYFDMFGYKVNRVKTPSKAHRENWWYTKTVDCQIDGHMPQKDLEKIKECYNNGIRFWRNGDNIGNYTLPNGIVD